MKISLENLSQAIQELSLGITFSNTQLLFRSPHTSLPHCLALETASTWPEGMKVKIAAAQTRELGNTGHPDLGGPVQGSA